MNIGRLLVPLNNYYYYYFLSLSLLYEEGFPCRVTPERAEVFSK